MKKNIAIGEHTYTTPEVPKNKKDILFWDKPKEKQYWLRQKFPDIFLRFIPNYTELYSDVTLTDDSGLLASLNKEDSDVVYNLLIQEKNRRRDGVWFYNNGEPTYITGSHYFSVQWAKMYAIKIDYDFFKDIYGDGISREEYMSIYADYGRYLKFQRDIFYLLDLVEKDKECLGVFLTKAKKVGMSMVVVLHLLNIVTMSRGKQIGIMSKKTGDAVETNMLYFYHALDGLPPCFKPNISKDARADGEIVFGAKSFKGKNIKQAALNKLEHNEALNSRVYCAPTKVRGFDAPVMSLVWIDEFPKLMQESHVSPKEVFDTNKATVKFQDDITGKMLLTSYVSEETDSGVDEARKVYFESKLVTKKGDKRTTSELICYHISSLYSYLSLIDRFGECNEVEANKRIENALLKAKNDPRAYQSLKRQLARNEKEAWEIGGTTSTFNVKDLTSYLYRLEEELANTAIPVCEYGYLKWENELWEIGKKDRRPKGQFCPVKFVHITEDDIADGVPYKFRIYKRIRHEKINLPLTFGRDDMGNLYPPDRFENVSGIDPTQYAAGSEVVEGSKNAMISMNFHDELLNSKTGKIESKVITADYFFRPDSPTETYEDMVKWIIYSGSLCIVEGNASYMATRMIEEGLINYMVVRNKEKVMCLGKGWMKLGEDCNLIRRTANADQNDILETLVRLITNYIEVIKGEPNYLETIKIVELIKQLISFDPQNTKVFDLVMAIGYCLLCYDIYYQSLFEWRDDSENVYSSILQSLSN